MARKSLLTEADKAEAEARRWKKELQLADKREKDWREEGEKIVKRYRGEEKKRNRFNVLWSNTEILRPAYYNSKPQPDVRRRFRDADPVGKAVSETLERALIVVTDGSGTDSALKNDVLDGLLSGRGVSRVRYVPQMAAPQPKQKSEKPEDAPGPESLLEDEALEYEYCCIEHIDWRDYREGYARVWEEVPWVAYRHKLTRADAREKFAEEDLASVEFTVPTTDDAKKPGEEVNETQKIAEFWEVWDRLNKRVFFFHDEVKHLIFPKDNPNGDPPLEFESFFPSPDPLRLVEDTGSRLPIPPFHLYQEQANELDKISQRIDRIVGILRLRGVYDAKLGEIADLTSADDNELIPIQNAQGWSDKGLDAAISWMPVEQAVKILEALYDARERQKAIIDELIGISDIVRGATDADETATAQQLKQSNASVRLLRPRQEVQRYARDLLRLAAEVMAQKFSPETFAEMTDLKFPTAQEKQVLQVQMQMAQAQGQPGPDPALLNVPTWDDIMGLMRSTGMRKFRIDVETDSTVAGALHDDMAGLTEVLGAVSKTMEVMAPMVMQGALPVDAAKEVVLTVVRRARLGMAVEDAFDKLKAPQPPPPPPDHAIEVAQIRAQSDEKIAQMKVQAEAQNTQLEHQVMAQTDAAKANIDAQRVSLETQMKAQAEAAEKEHKRVLAQMKEDAETQRLAMQLENARLIADAENQTKLMIAELQAQHAAELQKQKAETDQKVAKIQASAKPAGEGGEEAPAAADYKPVESELVSSMKELISHLAKPRRVVRDENGKIVGVQ